MKKLNSKGFAHQVLILALVVVAVIGGIGSYIYLRSSSASTPDGGGGASKSWHTVKSTGRIASLISTNSQKSYLQYSMPRNSTFRACVTARSYNSSSPTVTATLENANVGLYHKFGTTVQEVCTGSQTKSTSFVTKVNVSVRDAPLLVKKVIIQRYY